MVMLLANGDAMQVRYFMEESIAFSVKEVITIALESIVNLGFGDNFA